MKPIEYMTSEAKLRANEVRNALGLGDEPVSDVFRLLENQGIYLFVRPMQQETSAMFMRKRDVHLVIINSAHTLGHQFFSAAHELSHFLYDKNLMGAICEVNKINQDIEIERAADLFASHFLMPEQGLIKHISKRSKSLRIDLPDAIYLQQYFRVSWSAMLYRLLNVGLLSSAQVEAYRAVGIKRESSRLGYTDELYAVTGDIRHSQKYVENVIRALEHDEVSERKAEEYLMDIGTSLSDLSTVSDEEEGDYAR